MGIASRIHDTVESWQAEWKDRLRGWMASWVEGGVNSLINEIEPGTSLSVESILHTIRDNPDTPADLRDLINKVTAPGHPLPLLLVIPIAILLFIPTLTSIFQPLGNLLRYVQERAFHSWRLDPLAIITAWRRDPEKYAGLFDDLKDQGWNDDRIEALKFFTLFYPSPRDLVGFLAHEVYEDDMAARYGLDADFGEVAKHIDKFEKAGMAEAQVKEFWRDHWEHTSYMQMVEMLHRGLLTETGQPPPTTEEGWKIRDAEGTEILRDWYKLVEMADFWRDKLTAMAWNVPTRVDVRRWWDMRTISEEELRNVYHRQGYHGTDLDNYVLWTKVYTDFPMMMTRFSRGWINEEDIRTWLRGLEIPEDRITQFIQEKTWPEKPARTATEKDVTKTDIIKGVKQGVIERYEGVELLVDMGYDEAEADYILTINIPMDEEDKVVKERELSKGDIFKAIKLGTITSAEGVTKLVDIRYSPVDAEFLVDLTIKSKDLTKSDILKKFREAIITESRALTMLQEEGFSEEEAKFLLTQPPEEEIVVAKGREASKADIIKGVKKGLITPETAYLMLLDIGFTPEASTFILEVHAEESPFSPINYAEFKDVTRKYKKATGIERNEMPEEIRKAGAEVVRLTKDIESLQRSIDEEERGLLEEKVLPEETTARVDELRVSLHRAEAELSMAKQHYDSLIAEWRHRTP